MNGSAAAVAVCVPAFRPDLALLEACLASAVDAPELAELVVSDDTDGPEAAAVADLADRFGATYVPGPRTGLAGNWNAAVRASSARWVLVLHQDDALVPGSLGVMLQAAEEVGADVVGGGAVLVAGDGSEIDLGTRRWLHHRSRIFQSGERYALSADRHAYLTLRNGQILGEPSTVLIRRSLFDALDGFRSTYHHGCDVDFNLRAVNHADGAAIVGSPVAVRRFDPTTTTSANMTSGTVVEERGRLIADFAPGRDGLAAFEAAAGAHAVLHFVRALRSGSRAQAREAIAGLRRAAPGLRPGALARYGAEIIRNDNADRSSVDAERLR